MRERGEAFAARHLRGEALSLQAEIPGSAGPLWQVRLEAASEPQANGERVRLRAHFRLSLRGAPERLPSGTARGLPARLGRFIERRLSGAVLRRLAAPLLGRDLSAWVEVRASSAALDEGSRALVPERLASLGVEPRDDRPLQTWAGALQAPRPGFAMLTLLTLDKERLPAPLRRALGAQPFQLTATLVNVVEDA